MLENNVYSNTNLMKVEMKIVRKAMKRVYHECITSITNMLHKQHYINNERVQHLYKSATYSKFAL